MTPCARIEALAGALSRLAHATAAHVCWQHGADAHEIAAALDEARRVLATAAPTCECDDGRGGRVAA